ncbi:MAG: DUF4150 domain-containing protein, partial [Betaproteobacteria bacterium]|nr:DUF4150 domain-containing protein [Betaproteobacteria bacterium]
TGLASDTSDGSSSVQISGQEVMLKDKSCFKKSMGDEAGCAPKKGVVTSKNMGKVYFTAWSMNVKVEGENVVRMGDLTTHNHGSVPGNTGPWPYLDEVAVSAGAVDHCEGTRSEITNKCKDESEFAAAGPSANGCSADCCEAKKCALAPYGSGMQCCDQKTKHHIIPDHCFKDKGKGGYYDGIKDMSYGKGLAICVSGEDKADTDAAGNLLDHGKIHRDFDRIEDQYRDSNAQKWTFDEANAVGSDVCAFYAGCDQKCLARQTETYHRGKGVHGKTTLRANSNDRTKGPSAIDRTDMGNSKVIWSSRG